MAFSWSARVLCVCVCVSVCGGGGPDHALIQFTFIKIALIPSSLGVTSKKMYTQSLVNIAPLQFQSGRRCSLHAFIKSTSKCFKLLNCTALWCWSADSLRVSPSWSWKQQETSQAGFYRDRGQCPPQLHFWRVPQSRPWHALYCGSHPHILFFLGVTRLKAQDYWRYVERFLPSIIQRRIYWDIKPFTIK